MNMTPVLEHEEFSKHLNTTFRIYVNETETVESELSSVSERMVSPRQERFSIVFRTSNDFFLGQGMRRFDHDQMGSFDLFIVPIARDDEGTLYESVFNLLVQK